MRTVFFVGLLLQFVWAQNAFSQQEQRFGIIHVGKNGHFSTIQSAIDASAAYQHVTIVVEHGVYEEKLFINRNNIAIVGESAAQTSIEMPILRKRWRQKQDNDWGAAVVNIDASNVILANLTITNTYGALHGDHDHQFAIRGFSNSDKIIIHNSRVIAGGADTLSLWNKHGRYYHSYSFFEGYVDMVCPRGTALIEHSDFYNRNQTPSLWHDGELSPHYKFVVNESRFDGEPGFLLGRHHYDAQFYLLNSTFSQNMVDTPIFRKTYKDKSRDRANLYGARYFFQNNQSESGYSWARDNFRLRDVVDGQDVSSLSDWVFGGSWQPLQELARLEKQLAAYFSNNRIKQRFNLKHTNN